MRPGPHRPLDYATPEKRISRWCVRLIAACIPVCVLLSMFLLCAGINFFNPDFADPHPIGRNRTQWPTVWYAGVGMAGMAGLVICIRTLRQSRRDL